MQHKLFILHSIHTFHRWQSSFRKTCTVWFPSIYQFHISKHSLSSLFQVVLCINVIHCYISFHNHKTVIHWPLGATKYNEIIISSFQNMTWHCTSDNVNFPTEDNQLGQRDISGIYKINPSIMGNNMDKQSERLNFAYQDMEVLPVKYLSDDCAPRIREIDLTYNRIR